MAEGRRLRGEAGSTLVELVVTIAIMGIAFTTLLGGTFTAVAASDRHRKAAAAETVLASFAEAIKRAGYSETCSAEFYEGQYPPTDHFTQKVTECKALQPPVDGAQLLTLVVTSDDGRAREEVVIVKREVE